jgi:DNA ligase-4
MNDSQTEEEPQNFGGPLPSFKFLTTNLFAKLDRVSPSNTINITEQKRQIIEIFIKQWRGTVGNDIYPAMRLILPHRDKRMYNLKDHYLAKRILEVLKIPKASNATDKVMNWKRGGSSKMSEICIEVIKERRSDVKGDKISIDELNDKLDRLASFDCKKQEQLAILKYLIDNMSFEELRYLFDILLKKNIVRNMENTILYTWHPDSISYFKVVSNLKTVCHKLYNPSTRLSKEELNIQIAHAFAPQLSKRLTYTYSKIAQLLDFNFIIEEKMDGERIQLHYDNYGSSIHYWSRRGTDYTYLYGSDLSNGCISPHIQLLSSVQSIVIDGEMVSYDPLRQVILPFGVLKGSAIQELQRLNGDIRTSDNLTARPLFIVFDIVFLNGVSLTNKPLSERKKFLNAVLKPKKSFVEIINAIEAHDEMMITKALELAISKGSEGIILKQTQGRYLIDKRSESWIKIKPEYLEEFGENVDLIVIGRDKSLKDIYYCGLLHNNEVWCFCRVANGFDQDDYRKIDSATQGKWKITDEVQPAEMLKFGKRVPHEWIHPNDSFIIEVRARSVDRSISKNYKVDTTLYNAYCRRIREDKPWTECATLEEYKRIKTSNREIKSLSHKLAIQRRLERKRKLDERDEETWNDVSTIQSDILLGFTFMIITDGYYESTKYSIEEIHNIIASNGGLITKSHTLSDPRTLRVIGNKQTNQAQVLREQGYDILRLNWVFDSIKFKSIVKILPKHCLLVSDALAKGCETRVDDLKCGYTEMFTEQSLMKVLNENDGVEMCDYLKIGFFHGLKPYVAIKDMFARRFVQLKLKQFGGLISESIDACNIVIFVHSQDSSDEDMNELRELSHNVSQFAKFTDHGVHTIRMVSSQWVYDSIEMGIQADPKDYFITFRE